MYVCFRLSTKKAFKNKFSLKLKRTLCKQTGKCAFDNILRDDENPLAGLLPFILQFRATGKDPIPYKLINML